MQRAEVLEFALNTGDRAGGFHDPRRQLLVTAGREPFVRCCAANRSIEQASLSDRFDRYRLPRLADWCGRQRVYVQRDDVRSL